MLTAALPVSAALAVGTKRVISAPPAAAAAPAKNLRRFTLINFSLLSMLVFVFFGISFCSRRNRSFLRPATAHGAFQFGARNPVIAQGLDVATLRDLFALFGREQVVITFLHRIVLKQCLAQDALALRQENFLVILSGVARGDERVTGLPHFGANVDGQRLEVALRLTILGSEARNPRLALIKQRHFQIDCRADHP